MMQDMMWDMIQNLVFTLVVIGDYFKEIND